MKKYFLYFLFLICFKSLSQDKYNQRKYFFYLKSLNYDKANKIAEGFNDYNLKLEAISLTNLLYNSDTKEKTVSKKNKTNNNFYRIIFNLRKGYFELYKKPNSIAAFNYFNKALELSKQTNNKEAYKFSLISLFLFYNKQVEQTNNEHLKLLKSFEKILEDDEDKFHYYINTLYFELRKISRVHDLEEVLLNDFSKLINNFQLEHPFWVYYYSTLGIYYRIEGDTRAEKNIKKSLALIKHPYQKHINLRCYIHLSHIYKSRLDYDKALQYLKKAEKNIDKNDSLKMIYFLNLYKSDIYKKKKDYKNAFKVLSASVKQKDELAYLKNNIEISNLNIKYKTVEKEKQILELDTKRKQNFSFLVATLLSLILISIIGTLSLTNSKRKRKLAEKEKELETIKNLTLLKEQEITTINAMVDGQEKERKRIAEDLHDNLGSVLATLKLHFENLKINREKKKIDQKELFNKTENLIDEAYLKVRRIAHAKNAGVIANQGLLLAIQMMAEKISSADKIQIEVIHFGLDKRLENILEITLFRIIQELITNIIKHADAKNATINISLYDKNLNIIIEDDGKGFDIKKVNLNNGMGISSIKTRVEHLNGNFKVDSTLGKGSSIILDIPVS
ncbi:ATP-binding protein [Polaribacter sp. Asnod6-C07]|uniref:sensor histidine kinase n=1 Tax=Polaribacter sp. Asnod6-C07 TaxID=3160582 RepID=UPI00386BA966